MTDVRGVDISRIWRQDGSRYAMALLLILLCAFSLRVGRCFVTDKLNPDSIFYIDMAREWAGDGLEAAFASGHRIPPLYPGLMALGEYAGIGAEQAGRMISVLAGTAAVLAAFVIARLVLRSMPLVLFATALAATHPYLVRISENVLRDSLFICLEAWAIAFAMLGARTRRLGWWCAAGVATFLAESTRTEGLEIIPILVIWCCWELWRGRADFKKTAKRTLPGPVLASSLSFALLIPAQLWLQRLTASTWGLVFTQFLQYQALLSASKTATGPVASPEPSPGAALKIAQIFSPDFIMSLLGSIASTVFPTSIGLAVMAVFNRKAFRLGPALNLLLSALLFLVASRLALIAIGMPDSRRYFLMLAFLLTALAAPGLLVVTELVKRFWPSFQRHGLLMAFLAGAVLLVCSGKALNPAFDKTWIHEAAAFIKSNSANAQAVFVFSDMDRRIAYYANAKGVSARIGYGDEVSPFSNLKERMAKYRHAGVKMFIVPDSAEDFDEILASPAGKDLVIRKVKEFPKRNGCYLAIYEAE